MPVLCLVLGHGCSCWADHHSPELGLPAPDLWQEQALALRESLFYCSLLGDLCG